MKAVTFNPNNDEFTLKEIDKPTARGNKVLIQVLGCGLNPVDAKIIYWKEMAEKMNDEWVVGLDISGVIVEIGDEVKGWSVGDRVLCHGNMFEPHGGLAEYTLQNANMLLPHPNIEPHIAASYPCAGWTAYRALFDKLNIEKHNSILITGASGGVGGFATQLAAHCGLENIIVTCSKKNEEYAKSLGATHVIDYSCEDVVATVLEITDNQGVDIGFDTVGFGNDVIVANALGYEGEMVELVDVVKPSKYHNAFMRGLSFHQLTLGSGHHNGKKGEERLLKAAKAFNALVESKCIKPAPIQIISLEEAPIVLKDILKQRTVGKIVMSF